MWILNGVPLIREWRLFEAWRLLEEIQYRYIFWYFYFCSICKSVSKLLCSEFFVILFLILLPVKPPVASAVFFNFQTSCLNLKIKV